MMKIECDGCGASIDPLKDGYTQNPVYSNQHFCADHDISEIQDYLTHVFAPAWKEMQLENRARLKNLARTHFKAKPVFEVANQ